MIVLLMLLFVFAGFFVFLITCVVLGTALFMMTNRQRGQIPD